MTTKTRVQNCLGDFIYPLKQLHLGGCTFWLNVSDQLRTHIVLLPPSVFENIAHSCDCFTCRFVSKGIWHKQSQLRLYILDADRLIAVLQITMPDSVIIFAKRPFLLSTPLCWSGVVVHCFLSIGH